MNQPLSLPSTVRCNRGFGLYFWLTMAIFGVLTLIAVAAKWREGPSGVLPMVGVGLIGITIVVGVRAFVLPRLEISPAEGTLRTRRRVTPLAVLSAVSVTSHGRAGIWADFIGPEGRRVGRMSISGSLFAAPDSMQWAALRHAILQAIGSAGAHTETLAPSQKGRISARAAMSILDAQIAWCQAGHGPNSRHAPARALIGTRIVLFR